MYNHRSLILTAPPNTEPVALADAKAWCRVDTTADDALISSLITRARSFCEGFVGRQFMPATYNAIWDRFPMLPNSQYAPGNPNAITPPVNNMWPLNPSAWSLRLPMPPVTAVNSIKYLNTQSVLTTMEPATYTSDLNAFPARIVPTVGSYWPMTSFAPSAVQVSYAAGDGNPPAEAVQAILMLVAYWYTTREAMVLEKGVATQAVPLGVKDLLWSRRVMSF